MSSRRAVLRRAVSGVLGLGAAASAVTLGTAVTQAQAKDYEKCYLDSRSGDRTDITYCNYDGGIFK